MAYRYLIIPITKQRLAEREGQFKWIYRHDFPEWGTGRDDAMNLTKYFMISWPMDDRRPDRHAVGVEPEEIRL